MSQTTGNAPNQTPASYRANANEIFESVFTLSSGPSEPPATFPSQLWADTSSGTLKQRDSADTEWLYIGRLDENGQIRTHSGDPNGSITGDYEGELCFDTSNKAFYFASSTVSATWSPISGDVQESNFPTSGTVAAFIGGPASLPYYKTIYSATLCLCPFLAPKTITIRGLRTHIDSTTSTTNLYSSVYSSDADGQPDSRLAYSNAVSHSSGAYPSIYFTANITLEKGRVYWLGLSHYGGSCTYYCIGGPSSATPFSLVPNAWPGDYYPNVAYSAQIYRNKTGVTGVHPDPIGTTSTANYCMAPFLDVVAS